MTSPNQGTMHEKILVTGAAGFIGHFVSERLLARGDAVVGLDNLDDYYDPTLKEARRLPRLCELHLREGASLEDQAAMRALFDAHAFDGVVTLQHRPGCITPSPPPTLKSTATSLVF